MILVILAGVMALPVWQWRDLSGRVTSGTLTKGRAVRRYIIRALAPSPFGKWISCGGVLAALCSTPCNAQGPTLRSWTSFALGFGPAGAGMRGDTVYEGSGQVFARIGYARQLAAKSALEIEVVGGRPFGAGDCIPRFTICAPAFNFVGASTNLLTSLGGPIAPPRFIAGLGAGFFRVAPTESHGVSPRPALGIQASLELPLIVGAHAAFTLGLRGLIWPTVHGQSLGVGLLTAGLRTW